MANDDPTGVANLLEPLTFYTMEKRADDIGQEGLYAILRLIFLAVRPDSKLRINLLGHSFGCKVVCAALERLAVNSIAVPPSIAFNVLFQTIAYCNAVPHAQRPARTIGPQCTALMLAVTSVEHRRSEMSLR